MQTADERAEGALMQTRASWAATDVAGKHARDGRQNGQGSIEYVGMVVGVAALIIALISVFPSVGDNLTCKLSQAIASVGGGSAECSDGGSGAKEEHGGRRAKTVAVATSIAAPSTDSTTWHTVRTRPEL